MKPRINILGSVLAGVVEEAGLDFVSSLGVDHVIDYTVEDFRKRKQTRKYSHSNTRLMKRCIILTLMGQPEGTVHAMENTLMVPMAQGGLLFAGSLIIRGIFGSKK